LEGIVKKLIVVIFLAVLLCFTFACQNKAEKAELEKFRTQAKVEEQNKELFRKVIEEFNKRNFDFLMEAYAPDYVYYYPSGNPKPMSREELIAMNKMIRVAFPDLNWSVEDLVAVGDMVVSRNIIRGTHKGTFQGIPATGNKVEFSLMIMCRIRDGKVVEEREDYDTLTIMQQLGFELKPKEAEKK
jgi:steroid delta-isomerase-like uncharacterized protein